MSDHKWKNEDRGMAKKSGLSMIVLAALILIALVVWQQHPGGNVVSGTVDSFGGLIGAFFGLIGSIIGGVFGLIGHIIGLVFSVIGVVLGLVGTIIGLVFGFVGLILGLVFGVLGLVMSLIIPLILLVLAVKLFGLDKSRQQEKSKRKNEWRDDGITDV
jgi:phage-related protein